MAQGAQGPQWLKEHSGSRSTAAQVVLKLKEYSGSRSTEAQ